MKKLLLLSVLALLLGASSDAFAQRGNGRGWQGNNNNRQDRQRIRRGIERGQITRDEARQIRERQRDDRAEHRGYRADGQYTRDERREVRRDERRSDRQIRRYRRNDDSRWNNNNGQDDHQRGNGYYRRGRGSRTHPVFGRR